LQEDGDGSISQSWIGR